MVKAIFAHKSFFLKNSTALNIFSDICIQQIEYTKSGQRLRCLRKGVKCVDPIAYGSRVTAFKIEDNEVKRGALPTVAYQAYVRPVATNLQTVRLYF